MLCEGVISYLACTLWPPQAKSARWMTCIKCLSWLVSEMQFYHILITKTVWENNLELFSKLENRGENLLYQTEEPNYAGTFRMQWGVAQLQTKWNWCSQLARLYPQAHMKAQPWSQWKERRRERKPPPSLSSDKAMMMWYPSECLSNIETMNYTIYFSSYISLSRRLALGMFGTDCI